MHHTNSEVAHKPSVYGEDCSVVLHIKKEEISSRNEVPRNARLGRRRQRVGADDETSSFALFDEVFDYGAIHGD